MASQGIPLKASNKVSLVAVTIAEKEVTELPYKIEDKEIEMDLTAKEDGVYELPYDKSFSIEMLDSESIIIDNIKIAEEDFDKEKELSKWQKELETEQTNEVDQTKDSDKTNKSESTELSEEINETTSSSAAIFRVEKNDQEGSIYFRMKKDQKQRIKVKNTSEKNVEVTLYSLSRSNDSQELLNFLNDQTKTTKSSEPLESIESSIVKSELSNSRKNFEEKVESKSSEIDKTTKSSKDRKVAKSSVSDSNNKGKIVSLPEKYPVRKLKDSTYFEENSDTSNKDEGILKKSDSDSKKNKLDSKKSDDTGAKNEQDQIGPQGVTNNYTPYTGDNLSEYKLDTPSSWVDPKFDNKLDFSKSQYSVINGDNSITPVHIDEADPANENDTKMEGIYFQNFKDNRVYNHSYGLHFTGVVYDNRDEIDIKVVIDHTEVAALPSGNSAKNSAVHLTLRYYKGLPYFGFWVSRTIGDLRYHIEFYEKGSATPYKVDLPLIFGDIDNGEQQWIEHGANSTIQPNIYPNIFRELDEHGLSDLKISKINGTDTIVLEPKKNDHGDDVDNFKSPSKVPSMTFSGSKIRDHWVKAPEAGYLASENQLVYWETIGFHSSAPTQITEPKKYVSDTDEELVNKNTLSDIHEKFTYTLEASFPQSAHEKYNLKKWEVTDVLPPGVTLDGAINNIKAIAQGDGDPDVTNSFDYDYNAATRKITITAKSEPYDKEKPNSDDDTVNDPEFYSKKKNIRFIIPAKIEDVTKLTTNAQGKIEFKNTCDLSVKFFSGDEQTKSSNEVVTGVELPDQLSIKKSVDKALIEVGNEIDPAQPSDTKPTEVTYTLSAKNGNVSFIEKVRILDVLPNNSDTRGSNFKAGYKVTGVSTTTPGAVVYYNTADPTISEGTDPNSLTLTPANGWIKLSTAPAGLDSAKAIVVEIPKVAKEEEVKVNVSIQPINQKAADHFVNHFSLNSELKKKIESNKVETDVLARDLAGLAWYDESYDGLIGNKSDGLPEDWANTIPVKLYRTSKVNQSYVNELVKESLTGEKFVDSAGDSLKKTDSNGKYIFENLPEGDYIAEFILENQVVRVTKKLIGTDPAKNSKANISTAKTDKYSLPTLSNLASLLETSDQVHHTTDVNVGLIPPSIIRLFKYAEGSVEDANGDGIISDAEKLLGTPLGGAEFEIYDDSGEKIGVATTDNNGKLEFNELFPGEYELIESKAPAGYELIKTPIKVSITKGSQIIQLYKSDNKATKLPFTGGNGPQLIILAAACAALMFGFGYLLWHYRTPKKKGGR